MAQLVAPRRVHKRGFELVDKGDEKSLSDGEFNERVKRQRLTLYKGMASHEPEYKAGLFYQLGAWICQNHGFYLKHPITGVPELCHCPASAFPFDSALTLYEVPSASFGLPYFKIDGEACSSREESEILAHAIGSQQWAFFIGLIYGVSVLMPVVDEKVALRCRHCDKRASDADVYLLTVAEEYKATCDHPIISSDDVEWATDDRYPQHGLYGSCALPNKPREREGSAICLRCLYTEVMVHDPLLMTDLASWYAFDVAAMKNLLSPGVSDVRRLCGCQHPSLMGAMCLFRFSRVLVPNRDDFILANTTQFNTGAMIKKMVNDHCGSSAPSPLDAGMLEGHSSPMQDVDTLGVDAAYAFDAYDPSISSLFSSGVGFSKRYIDLASSLGIKKASGGVSASSSSFPPPSSEVDSTGGGAGNSNALLLDAGNVATFSGLAAFIDRRFGFAQARLDQILNVVNQRPTVGTSFETPLAMATTHTLPALESQTNVQQPQPQQPPPAPSSPPLQHQALPTEEQIQKMSPQEVYQFMVSQASAVDAYYQASKRLVSLYGERVIVNHDSVSCMPPYCKSCSCYGHSSIKTCPYATDKKTKPRNKGTRSDHFAGNIKPFTSGNKEAMLQMVDKNRYEARTLLENMQVYFVRHSRNVLPPRGGPSSGYMGFSQEGVAVSAKNGDDDEDDGDDGDEVTASKASASRKRKTMTLLTPSIPFETLATLAEEDYETTLDYELFTSLDYLRQAHEYWSARKFATEDLVDLKAWLTELRSHISQHTPFNTFLESQRSLVWKSLSYFVHHRNRLVDEQSLAGDELSLANTLKQKQGGLTGWIVTSTQNQPPASSSPPPPLPQLPAIPLQTPPPPNLPHDPMNVDSTTTTTVNIDDLEIDDSDLINELDGLDGL